MNEDKKSYKFLTKDGEASATFEGGDTFEGTYAGIKRNGKGKYVFKIKEGWASAASYDGDYKDDMKHGFGTFVYPDGSKYVGEWTNDLRHGQGEYTYASGDVYKGSWKNGKKSGEGVYNYPPGSAQSSIVGTWVDGKISRGTWTLPDGTSYVGGFEANRPCGQGVFLMSSGNTVRGVYKKQMVPDEDNEGQMKESGPPQWKEGSLSATSETKLAAKLQRTIRRAKFRLDQSKDVQVVDDEVAGVPNFTMLDDSPPKIFGFGTPSLKGYSEVLKKAKTEESGKVFLIVTRQDPVCYVPTSDGDSQSYSPCPRTNPGSDYDFTTPNEAKDQEELVKQFQNFELEWVACVRADVKASGTLCYLEPKNTTPQEAKLAAGANITPQSASRSEEEGGEIKNVLSSFAETEDEALVPLEYAIVPMASSGAPSSRSIDALIKTLKERDFAGEVVAFSNRTGLGSVQFGMAVAGLMHLIKNPPPAAEEGEKEEEKKDEEKTEGEETPAAEEKEKIAEEKAPADLSKGEYKPVMDIVNAVPDGKGAAIKADVDAMAARCQGADLVGCITKEKNTSDLSRYAALLLTYIYMKAKLDDEESTFDAWMAAPEQEAMAAAFKSCASFKFE